MKESFEIVTDTLHVLMEGTPKNILINDIKKLVEQVEGVVDIHHLHVWTVGDDDIHLEAHINIKNMLTKESDLLRTEIEKLFHDNFDVHHSTIQFECGVCEKVGLIKN